MCIYPCTDVQNYAYRIGGYSGRIKKKWRWGHRITESLFPSTAAELSSYSLYFLYSLLPTKRQRSSFFAILVLVVEPTVTVWWSVMEKPKAMSNPQRSFAAFLCRVCYWKHLGSSTSSEQGTYEKRRAFCLSGHNSQYRTTPPHIHTALLWGRQIQLYCNSQTWNWIVEPNLFSETNKKEE